MENSKRGNGGHNEGYEEMINSIQDKYFERLEKNTKYFTNLFKTIAICITVVLVFVVIGMY